MTTPPQATATRSVCCSACLDVGYERVPVDIFAGDRLTPRYAQLDRARGTPVLQTAHGTHLVQSNAILWGLAVGGTHLPELELAHAQILVWLCFEQERGTPATAARASGLTSSSGPTPDHLRASPPSLSAACAMRRLTRAVRDLVGS